jgi:hypothetical protein
MKTPLIEFRSLFRNRVLELVWSQWIAMGIQGSGKAWTGSPIDPEALLLASCTVARRDARLFDAVVEWMQVHGRYLNVQRVKRIFAEEEFAGDNVYGAIACKIKTSSSVAKWTHGAKNLEPAQNLEPLFRLANGSAMPNVGPLDPEFEKHGLLRDVFRSRGIVGDFDSGNPANLILRLRSMFGVNARCEIIAYLLLHKFGAPRSIASKTFHSPATIIKALKDMRESGFIYMRIDGRKSNHWLEPELWQDLFQIDALCKWMIWPRLFRGIEQIWMLVEDDAFYAKEPLTQASIIRRVLLDSTIERLDSSGPGPVFGDISNYHGEKLIPYFKTRTLGLLDKLTHPRIKTVFPS